MATIREVSGGRLLLGVGVGWMAPEFRALGLDRRRRGADRRGGLSAEPWKPFPGWLA